MSVIRCGTCGEKITKHIDCQRAKRQVLISEFVEKLEWILEDFYNEDEENRVRKIKEEYEKRLEK